MGDGWVSLLCTFNIVVVSMRLANAVGEVLQLTLLTRLNVKICGLKVSQHLNSPFRYVILERIGVLLRSESGECRCSEGARVEQKELFLNGLDSASNAVL